MHASRIAVGGLAFGLLLAAGPAAADRVAVSGSAPDALPDFLGGIDDCGSNPVDFAICFAEDVSRWVRDQLRFLIASPTPPQQPVDVGAQHA